MKNKRQFEKILIDLHDRKTAAMNKKINKVYQQAFKSIESELNKVWLEMMVQEEISAATMYRAEHWKALQEVIQQQMVQLGATQQQLLQMTLLDAFRDAYIATNGVIGGVAEFSIIQENVARKIVEAKFADMTIVDRVLGTTNITGQQIQKAIIDTAIVGKDFRKVSAALKQVLGTSRSATDRLIRTETMRVLNEAQKQSYKDRGYDTVIWLAEIDERTCKECKKIDGKEYAIDDAPSIVHPNCRCTCYPKID